MCALATVSVVQSCKCISFIVIECVSAFYIQSVKPPAEQTEMCRGTRARMCVRVHMHAVTKKMDKKENWRHLANKLRLDKLTLLSCQLINLLTLTSFSSWCFYFVKVWFAAAAVAVAESSFKMADLTEVKLFATTAKFIFLSPQDIQSKTQWCTVANYK